MERFIFLMLLALVHIHEVQADIGPKPSVEFSLTGTADLQLVDGVLLQCEHADCSDAKPLERLGPQHFGCSEGGCSGVAYGFSPYMQLRLTFGIGKQLTSPLFQKKEFDARFAVIVKGETMQVTEQ